MMLILFIAAPALHMPLLFFADADFSRDALSAPARFIR